MCSRIRWNKIFIISNNIGYFKVETGAADVRGTEAKNSKNLVLKVTSISIMG